MVSAALDLGRLDSEVVAEGGLEYWYLCVDRPKRLGGVENQSPGRLCRLENGHGLMDAGEL
jgi:hypothetical protein